MGRANGRNSLFLLVAAVVLAVGAASCGGLQQSRTVVDPNDLSYLYNPSVNSMNPRFRVTTESDNMATLMIKLFANELLFSQANELGVSQAKVEISVKLFDISLMRTLIDTSYADLTINRNEQLSEYIFEIPLRVSPGKEYMTEIKILDRQGQSTYHSFVSFNTLSDNNMYNFTLRGDVTKNEVFNPVLRADEFFNIKYSRKPVDSLFISFYEPFDIVPDPPSMVLPQRVIDYEPTQIVALLYSDTLALMLPARGVYKISVGRDIAEGYTICNLGKEFPQMTTPENMFEPLAYLCSQAELEALRSAEKPKLALDNFWLSCGGNIEKARELIRIYYTRVVYANYYFTSFTDGWRTERGMIYMMYGPPDKLYKSDDGESWGYLKPEVKTRWGNIVSVKDEYIFFNFKKRESLFSDNDYYLSRSESLVTNWDQAVNSWRSGVVFRLDNPTDF